MEAQSLMVKLIDEIQSNPAYSGIRLTVAFTGVIETSCDDVARCEMWSGDSGVGYSAALDACVFRIKEIPSDSYFDFALRSRGEVSKIKYSSYSDLSIGFYRDAHAKIIHLLTGCLW